jgi:hypothetical protein
MAMILHSQWHQVPGLVIQLSDQQTSACSQLQDAINDGRNLHNSIHKLGLALLETSHPDIARNEWLCPLHRFLVAYHLKEDNTFPEAKHITSNLSQIQWFFRAVACVEANEHHDKHQNGVIG